MYHVMIVDDELYARVRMQNEFSLEQDGFTIDQEASNGREAMEKMNLSKPDILITDMRMPVMDGLELIRQMKHCCPSIPVLALSGYDDYAYVRNSLQLGATDYLLKHQLQRDYVLGALRKCADEIEARNRRERIERQAAEDQRDSRKVRKRDAVMKLLVGDIGANAALASLCMLPAAHASYQVLMMKINNWRGLEKQNGRIQMVMLDATILSIAQEVIDQTAQGTAETIGDGEYVVLFAVDGMYSRQYVRDVAGSMVSRLEQNITKYINITVSFAVGKVVSGLDEIADSYRQAQEGISLSHLSDKKTLLWSDGEKSPQAKFVTLSNERYERLSCAVKNRMEKECLQLLDALFADLLSEHASRASCQIICIELLNLIIRSISSMPLGESVTEQCQECKSRVMVCDHAQENFHMTRSMYVNLFVYLNETKEMAGFHSHTLRAIEYIRHHPTDELSLSSIAERLNINKSYLSRIFSQDLGQGLTEYVTGFRIEEAKKALASGLPIKDAAAKAGFGNLSYFFRVFKQYAGQTPQDYQRNMSIFYAQEKNV